MEFTDRGTTLFDRHNTISSASGKWQARLSTSFGSLRRQKDEKDTKTPRLPNAMYLSPERRESSLRDVQHLYGDRFSSPKDIGFVSVIS